LNIVKQHAVGPVRSFEMGYAPIGAPFMTVRFYYLAGVLIDTGQSNMRRHALDAVRDLPIEQVLLTHHHEDHSGNAAAIARLTGAPVRGHAVAAAKLRQGFPIQPYQHVYWGRAAPVRVEPVEGPIEAGQFALTPIETPGHSKDHVVFLEHNRGWLFSGDLFIGERIKFFRSDEKMGDQIQSLKKVLELDFDALFCAHHPRLTDGKQHLARKLDFLETLRSKALDLKQQGYPVRQIIRRLDPRKDRTAKWITMGNVSFANMVRSALDSPPS
jgi:glyoxylase-like metal-dependent hydrolase (beta-lactamase superfamily II)